MSFKDIDFHQLPGCVLDLRPETGTRDRSGYENHGTYEGGMGVVGDEFVFDGVDDYVYDDFIPASSSGSVSFQFSSTDSATNACLFASADESSNDYYLMVRLSSGKIQVASTFANGSNFMETKTSATFNDGNTHHVSVVGKSGTLSKIYVDGVLQTLEVDNHSRWFSDISQRDNAVIGARLQDTTLNYFEGKISNFQIYDRALSASEVAFLANQPLEPFGLLGGETLCLQPQRYSGTGDLLDESGNGVAVSTTSALVVSDESIQLSDARLLTTDLGFLADSETSVSCWVKTTDEQAILFDQSGANNGYGVFWLKDSASTSIFGNVLSGEILINGKVSQATSRHELYEEIATDTWTHVVFRFTTDLAWDDFQISRFGLRDYTGDLRDLRTFERLLSASEVKTLYNNGVSGYERPRTRRQYPGCVLDYQPVTGTRDRSYALNHGTYEGGAYSNGREFVFGDTNTSLIRIEDIPPPDNSRKLTVVCRFKARSLSGLQGLVNRYTQSHPARSWLMRLSGSTLQAGTNADTLITSTQLITLDTEYEIALVHTGTEDVLYINGVEDARASVNSDTGGDANDVFLGMDFRDNSGRKLNGTISKAQIYDTALTAGQITNLASDPDFEPFGNLGGEVLSIQPQRYKGSGDLIDESGNGNDGVLTGGALVSDNVISLDGVDGYIEVDSFDVFSGANRKFSVCLWFSTTSQENSTLISKADFANGQREWRVVSHNGKIEFLWYDNSVVVEFSGKWTDSQFNDGTPHHLVCNYDGTQAVGGRITIAIDGENQPISTSYSSGTPTSIFASLAPVEIGVLKSSNKFTNADISDVRIHNKNLSASEIKFLYNNGAPGVEVPNSRGAIAAYSPSYDEAGNGSATLLDYSGGANHGTLTSMDPATDWVDDTDEGGLVALDFDGVNDYVMVPGDLYRFVDADFSIITWVKLAAGTSQMLLNLRDADDDGWRLLYDGASSKIYASINTVDAISSSVIPSDSWQCIGCTFDAVGNAQIYLAGVADGTPIDISDQTMSTTANLTIGRSSFGTTAPLEGRNDSALIYGRILSQSEIQVLSQSRNVFAADAPSPSLILPSGLIHHYQSGSI